MAFLVKIILFTYYFFLGFLVLLSFTILEDLIMNQTKQDLLNISPEQAQELGRQSAIAGHSIHYDPYRNIDMLSIDNAHVLQNAWHLGHKSAHE